MVDQLQQARIAWKAYDEALQALQRSRTGAELHARLAEALHAERELRALLGPEKPDTREPEPASPHGDIPGKPGLPIIFEEEG